MKEWKGKFETAEDYQGAYERALLNEVEKYIKIWKKIFFCNNNSLKN
jgi:hypothetical protein